MCCAVDCWIVCDDGGVGGGVVVVSFREWVVKQLVRRDAQARSLDADTGKRCCYLGRCSVSQLANSFAARNDGQAGGLSKPSPVSPGRSVPATTRSAHNKGIARLVPASAFQCGLAWAFRQTSTLQKCSCTRKLRDKLSFHPCPPWTEVTRQSCPPREQAQGTYQSGAGDSQLQRPARTVDDPEGGAGPAVACGAWLPGNWAGASRFQWGTSPPRIPAGGRQDPSASWGGHFI